MSQECLSHERLVCSISGWQYLNKKSTPHILPILIESGSRRVHLSEQTILRWYYDWKRGGIPALNPTERCDKGKTQLSEEVQTALLQLKRDNPARSINTMIEMLERKGIVAKKTLARATAHRFLQQQKLSKRIIADIHTIERRSFVAERAGDIWHGDVLHDPSIQTPLVLILILDLSIADRMNRRGRGN